MINILLVFARVTRKGILVNQKYYSCTKAIREGWFEKAALQGSWAIVVIQDPLKDNAVFIPIGEELIPCRLIELGTNESSKIEAYFESIRVLKEYKKRHGKLKENGRKIRKTLQPELGIVEDKEFS